MTNEYKKASSEYLRALELADQLIVHLFHKLEIAKKALEHYESWKTEFQPGVIADHGKVARKALEEMKWDVKKLEGE